MMRSTITVPFVRRTTVETPPFPAPDQRWSATLVLSLIEDRVAGWELIEFVYSLPTGHEPFRFEANELESCLPHLNYRLHEYAGAWVRTHAAATLKT